MVARVLARWLLKLPAGEEATDGKPLGNHR
jgi:hypothetical protein